MEMALAKYRDRAAPADRYADLQRRAALLPQYSPSEGNSFLQNAAEGFGRSIYDTGRGLQQIMGQRSAEQIDEDRRLDAPLMATGGGLVGNIAGQAAQIAVPIPGAAAIKATSWAGKAAPLVGSAARAGGFAATQGVGTGETRAGNAGEGALWGAGGQVVASGLSSAARGVASRMEPVAAALARYADSMGFRLGLPQLSENPVVRTIASQMERMPFSGAGSRNAGNQETLNRRVAETFGADAKRITPDVFAKAKTKLSNTFETLTARNSLKPSPALMQEVGTVVDEATRLAGTDTARMVRGWVDELLSKTDDAGTIPGKAYQSFDTRLGKVLKSGGEAAHYLGNLREVVREGMDRSISRMDANLWQTARRQWASLKTVEPLVAKAPNGNISPAGLMGRVTADNAGKARMAAGNGGPLGELARIGQQYLKEAPNSGTADRLLVNAAVGSGLYGAQEGGLISPETALKIGGGLLANRVASKALNSRALAMGGSKPLTGLARAVSPAPRLLPAAAGAMGGPIPIAGGRVATPEEIAADEEIVRRFRERRGY